MDGRLLQCMSRRKLAEGFCLPGNCVQTLCRLSKMLSDTRLQDTAVDRIFGQLGGVLRCPLIGEKPYRHGNAEDLARLKEWAKKEIPELLGNKG
jgi:hypothetical protein